MLDEPWARLLTQIAMSIGLCVTATATWYHIRLYRKDANNLTSREYSRKAIWKYGLLTAYCSLYAVPFAPYRLILLLILFNVGMWKLVSHVRYRISERLNRVDGRERIPH
jgi:hypothetical protein